MSDRIHALAQGLTGTASVEECNLEEVQQIAQRFPYFAPAQFLFLQKLKQTRSTEAEAQSRKAVLYYPDPVQFEFFLASDSFYNEIIFEKSNGEEENPEEEKNKLNNAEQPLDQYENSPQSSENTENRNRVVHEVNYANNKD